MKPLMLGAGQLCVQLLKVRMLHTASVCTRCCMLLGVVSQSLKHLPTFLLFRDLRSVAQQSWTCLHSSSSIVGASYVDCTWFALKSYGFCPFHDALQVPKLLGVVASVCTPLPTRTQQLPTLLGQKCWEFLRLFAAAEFFISSRRSPGSEHIGNIQPTKWHIAPI